MAVQILALQQRATANDANGNPLAGAKIYTYETGTTTPLTTYTTSALSVANANPIVADSAGRFGPIYTDGSVAVKAVIKTSADVTVDTLDPAPFAYDSQSGADQISHTPNALLTSDTVQGALDQVTTELQTQASYYATSVGGTANAITVTTNIGIPALAAGMRVTFLPGSNNTGSTTLNVDGLGAVTCKTITGANLPADYILTTLGYYEAVYNGTNWVVHRVPDNGSGANGNWARSPDGVMTCWHSLTISSGGAATWTFPKAFSGSVVASATASISTDPRHAQVSAATTTSVDVYGFTPAGFAWNGTVRLFAIGKWY